MSNTPNNNDPGNPPDGSKNNQENTSEPTQSPTATSASQENASTPTQIQVKKPLNIQTSASKANYTTNLEKPRISIEKPVLAKKASAPISFQKNGKDIELSIKPSPNKDETSKQVKLQKASSTCSLEKSGPNRKALAFSKKQDEYSVESLCEQYTLYQDKIKGSVKTDPRRSRGYIALQNYLLEIKNGNKSTTPIFKPSKVKQKEDASLIVPQKDSFLPTIFRKKVDMWDNNSEEAFTMNVNQSFNRLTKDKLKQVLDELIPHVNSASREEEMVDTFIKKASSEKSFAKTYAEFVKELSKRNPNLSSNIIKGAKDKYIDYVLNPAPEDDEYECEISFGYASFIAALIELGQIADGMKPLEEIINNIPTSGYINPILIEMLKNFILVVGKTFIQKVDKSFWSKLESLLERKDIPSRTYYLIVDTLELINGTVVDNKTSQQPSEVKSLVRDGFASFQEDYTVLPASVEKLKAVDFFSGSMLLFPDIEDIYDFTYFQCFVLKKKKDYRNYQIIDILEKSIRSFAEQKIEIDCRHIWTNISSLLCQMIIHNVINIKEAQMLHAQIYYSDKNQNPVDDWNVYNDLKFFIYDNFDFSEIIESRPICPEIDDALRMPKLISESRNFEVRKVSRLIIVAVLRSIFALMKSNNEQSVQGMARWKKALAFLSKNYKKNFIDILKDEMENLDFPFKCEDVISFVIA